MIKKLSNKEVQTIITTYSPREKALFVMDSIAAENTGEESPITSEQQMLIMNSLATPEDKATWNTIREHAQKLEAVLNQLALGDMAMKERISLIEGLEATHDTEKLLLSTVQEIIDLVPANCQQAIVDHVIHKKIDLMSGSLTLIKGKTNKLHLSAENKVTEYIEDVNEHINTLAENQSLLLEDMEELLEELTIPSYKNAHDKLKETLESLMGEQECSSDEECC